uniref:BTB domain-containing protein n=1 Tax=Biomphalaria glabrata TaxID=6526 RepID=A0A2C9LAX0_BIOGL
MMNSGLTLTGGIVDNVRFESTDHGKSVLAGLQHLREMQQLFDVILVAESREFPAHRVVLASCSDYFRAMFTDGLRECKESRVCLNGLTASSIAHLIDFAYNSTINLDSDNVLDVLSGATHVQILPVINACENYLKNHLTIENCVNTARVAELFSLRHLQQHVLNFICRNWATFSMCCEFHHITPQFLMSVLSSGYPVNCKEIDVFMSVLSWFSYFPAERLSHVENYDNYVGVKTSAIDQSWKFVFFKRNKHSLPKAGSSQLRPISRKRLPKTKWVCNFLHMIIKTPSNNIQLVLKYTHAKIDLVKMGNFGEVPKGHCATDSWEVVGSLNTVRTYGTYTLDQDCIYAIGGWCDGDHAQKCRTIDTFDLRFQKWAQGPEQNIALWEHGSCSLYLPKFVPTT